MSAPENSGHTHVHSFADSYLESLKVWLYTQHIGYIFGICSPDFGHNFYILIIF